MKTIGKILKINLFALLALPLLIIGICAKLIAKALSKLPVMLLGLAGCFGVSLALELFRNPESMGKAFLTLLGALVILAIIILLALTLLSFISTLIAAAVMGGVRTVELVFEGIYGLCFSGYTYLYDACTDEQDHMAVSAMVLDASCLLFTILKFINRFIVLILKNSFTIMFVGCIAFVISSLSHFAGKIQGIYGIDLLTYLKLFNPCDTVLGIIMYLAITAYAILILISVGIEWHKWGAELDL